MKDKLKQFAATGVGKTVLVVVTVLVLVFGGSAVVDQAQGYADTINSVIGS